jgi:hypothetical protein
MLTAQIVQGAARLGDAAIPAVRVTADTQTPFASQNCATRSWQRERFQSERGLRAEAIHLPLVPMPYFDSRSEVHSLMISKELSKSRKSASSQ